MFFIDTDIILVTREDFGKVGCLVAWLVGHNPLPCLPCGRGGDAVGGLVEGVGRPGGDGAGPSGEGSSTGEAEVAAERAHADAVEARIIALIP